MKMDVLKSYFAVIGPEPLFIKEKR